jgi:hypothetical protein
MLCPNLKNDDFAIWRKSPSTRDWFVAQALKRLSYGEYRDKAPFRCCALYSHDNEAMDGNVYRITSVVKKIITINMF